MTSILRKEPSSPFHIRISIPRLSGDANAELGTPPCTRPLRSHDIHLDRHQHARLRSFHAVMICRMLGFMFKGAV
jgi:hypothetical protein